jgi:RNA polymerase-binding transcription factor DksA
LQEETRTLQEELDRLRDQITKLGLALEEKPDYGLGQGDPATTRWEINLALLEQSRERAAQLEQALSRVDRGEYGICRKCGESIHPDRLAVLPGTKLCIRCARAGESTRDR